MNSKDLYKAIGGADGDILERSEAANGRGRKNVWRKWGAMAACLCLVVIGTVAWRYTSPQGEAPGTIGSEKTPGLIGSEKTETPGNAAASVDGVTIPPMQVSLSASTDMSVANMLAFFIYQGRCYVQYEFLEDEDMVGEYLGTSTGLIDEWTPKEGYVELAGSVSTDFYAVKGYDPSFMLCSKDSYGVSTYICNNGITLKYGSELFEDRLHLSGGFDSVQYESYDSWNFSRGERYQMDSVGDVVLDFIREMNSAQFMLSDAVPLEGDTYLAETEVYHMYFLMKNGTTVHLRLCENGYVRFQGLMDVAIQVPEETYSVLLELLDSHRDATSVK